ncbi:MAG TPA: uroporphyrinogen-III synthase [Dongiaceae bacterium]|nr:uroporphyrinogen-III synthase [Dongiaceae bacterium]
MPLKNFDGRRVLSLESRRSAELTRLIEIYRGVPFSAPAVREVPVSQNEETQQFSRDLLHGSIDMVVFQTGVGARALLKLVEQKHNRETFLRALRAVRVAARGPKPLAVLREWDVSAAVVAPEPCTWRELVRALDEIPGGLLGVRVAIQEYGAPNPDFVDALRERGANVRTVTLYQWDLPENTAPLRQAITSTIKGEVHAALFTTGIQVVHLLKIAEEMRVRADLQRAFRKIFVASIGPSTSEALRRAGISVDLEPTHPKMGVLVKEAAERSDEILALKAHN